MMMIMTPSNWLKDSAGQTRMESKKDPHNISKVSFLSVKKTLLELGRTFPALTGRGATNPKPTKKHYCHIFGSKTLTTALV